MGCGRTRPVVVDPEPALTTGVSAWTFVHQRTGTVEQSYELLESLGRGAFAEVRKAVFKPTNDFRAIKIIHKIGLAVEGFDPKHQLRELKVLKELDHPNILRVYELIEDPQRYFLVMEYCQGGDLFSRLLGVKQFTEVQAGRIMYQLLSAVTYCHQRFVIHRDLKPENLLLESKGADLTLKVADFGSSAFLDPKKKLNGIHGSAYYVAPEVLEESYNEKCDLWSCGIIMYILMTGKAPYGGKNEREILSAVTAGELDLSGLGRLALDARDLITQCLVRNPRVRISATGALAHPFIVRCKAAEPESGAVLGTVMDQLRAFHCASKLKDAVHTFIATQIITQAEMSELRTAFQAIDKNGDGQISREELLEKYQSRMAPGTAEQDVRQIMSKVDTNNSGFLDYSEFLHASLDQAKHLSQKNLRAAFALFDTDGNGKISCEELKTMMMEGKGEKGWKEVVREVDQNGDGEIDLREFEQLVMERI